MRRAQSSMRWRSSRWLDYLFFRWVSPMLALGFRRPLQQTDIDSVRHTLPCWQYVDCESASKEFEQGRMEHGGSNSLMWDFYYCSRRTLWFAASLVLGRLLVILSLPICLDSLLRFLSSGRPARDGFVLAFTMLVLSCAKTLMENHYYINMQRTGVRALGILVRLIFRKSLQLSPSARAAQKAGKILNLMQLDAQRFYDASWFVHLSWSACLEVIGSTVLLFLLLGPPMLAGLAMMALLLPLNAYLAKLQSKLSKQLSKATDARMAVLAEAVGGIRAIKYGVWEDVTLRQVGEAREVELQLIRRLAVIRAMASIVSQVTPSVVALAAILCYTTVAGKALVAHRIFTALSLFDTLKDPLTRFPNFIASFIDLSVSAKRIEDFLQADEVTPLPRIVETAEVAGLDSHRPKFCMEIEGTFSWNQSTRASGAEARAGEGGKRRGPSAVMAELLARRKAKKQQKYWGLESKDEDEDRDAWEETENALAVEEETLVAASDVEKALAGTFQPNPLQSTIAGMVCVREALRIPAGKLTLVIGSVGSGKTSLLHALLSDLCCVEGSGIIVRTGTGEPDTHEHFEAAGGADGAGGAARAGGAGKSLACCDGVALLPQLPWLINGSLKQNITVGRKGVAGAATKTNANKDEDDARGEEDFDGDAYKAAVALTNLGTDIAALSAGDKTEIGEHGINLSGGQKQRVALARVLYSKARVAVLDDCLSALDTELRGRIFDQVLGPAGALAAQGCACVLAASSPSPAMVRAAEQVVVMRNCTVAAVGRAEDLRYVEEIETLLGVDTEAEAAVEAEAKAEAIEPRSLPSPAAAPQATVAGSENGGVASKGDGKLVTAEDRETGVVKLSVFKRFAEAAGLGGMLLVLLAYLAGATAFLGQSLWLAVWTEKQEEEQNAQALAMLDTSTNGTNSVDQSLSSASASVSASASGASTGAAAAAAKGSNFYLLVYSSFSVAVFLLASFRYLLSAHLALHASRQLHRSMCTAVMHAPVGWYDTTPTGRILNRLSRDCRSLDLQVWQSIQAFLDLFFPSTVTLLLVLYIVPKFLFFLPPLFYIFYRVQRYYRASSREMKRMLSISRTPMYNWFSGVLPASGLSTIRAYRLQDVFLAEMARLCDESNALQYVTKAMDRWLGTRFEFIGNVLFFGAAIVAIYSRHVVAAPYLALCLTSTLTVARAINYTLRLYTQCESEMTCVERVLYFASELPHERYSAYSYCRGGGKEQSLVDLPQPRTPGAELEFVGVSLRYRPNLPLVLKGVSFRVPAGTRVGVVGRSGSGKSTLVQALLRVVELDGGSSGGGGEGGRILWDGMDTSKVGVEVLRRWVAVCPQDCVLFTGTIRENVDPTCRSTDDDIAESLRVVGLAALFSDGKDGSTDAATALERPIAECGTDMSGGERQLLCLARVLLRCKDSGGSSSGSSGSSGSDSSSGWNPVSAAGGGSRSRLVVLDEATSIADDATDTRIQSVVREGFPGITILIIAHRLRSIIDADSVAVMAHGQLLEFGSPASLLAKSPTDDTQVAAASDAPSFVQLVRDSGEEDELRRLAEDAIHNDCKKLI